MTAQELDACAVMTSWEMEKAVNKTHANVRRDIQRRLQSRGIDHKQYLVQLPDQRGYRRWVYALPRGLAMELISNYSTTIRREHGASTDPHKELKAGWIPEARVSSREIAQTFGIRHDRVLRDIRRTLKRCKEDEALYRDDYPDNGGIFRTAIALPRRLLKELPYSYDGVLRLWFDLNTVWLAERARLKEQRSQATLEANREGRKWSNLWHRNHPVTQIQDKNDF